MKGLQNMLLSLVSRDAAGLAATADTVATTPSADPVLDAAAASADAAAAEAAAAEAAANEAAADAAAAPSSGSPAGTPIADQGAAAPSIEDAVAAANKRWSDVFASENSKGRERIAVRMLQTKMTSDEIVNLLGETPQSDASAEMLAALASQRNPNLGTGGTDAPSNHSQDVWDKAIIGLAPKRA